MANNHIIANQFSALNLSEQESELVSQALGNDDVVEFLKTAILSHSRKVLREREQRESYDFEGMNLSQLRAMKGTQVGLGDAKIRRAIQILMQYNSQCEYDFDRLYISLDVVHTATGANRKNCSKVLGELSEQLQAHHDSMGLDKLHNSRNKHRHYSEILHSL